MGQENSKKDRNAMRNEAKIKAECEKQRRIMEKETLAKFKLIDSLVGSSLTMKGMTPGLGGASSRTLSKKTKTGITSVISGTDKEPPNTAHSVSPWEDTNMNQSASMLSDLSASNATNNPKNTRNTSNNQQDLAIEYSRLSAYFEGQLKQYMKDRSRQIFIETIDGGERVVSLLARLFSLNVEDSLSNIAKNYKVDTQQRDSDMIFYHTNMLQRNFIINCKKNNHLQGSPRKEYQGQHHSSAQKQNSKQIKQLRKSLAAIIASDKAFLAGQLITKMNQVLIEMGYIVVSQQNKSSIASKNSRNSKDISKISLQKQQMGVKTDSSSSGGENKKNEQQSSQQREFDKINYYNSPMANVTLEEDDTFNSNNNMFAEIQLKQRRTQSERTNWKVDNNKYTSSCDSNSFFPHQNNNISVSPNITNNAPIIDISLNASGNSDGIYECVLNSVVEARSVRFCLSVVCNAVGYLVSRLISKTLSRLQSPSFGQDIALYQHILCGQVAELLVFTAPHKKLYLAAINTEFNMLCKDKLLNFEVNDHELEVYLQQQNIMSNYSPKIQEKNRNYASNFSMPTGNDHQFNPQVGTFNDQGVAGLGKLSIFAVDVRSTPNRKLSGKDNEMDQDERINKQQSQENVVGNNNSNKNQLLGEINNDISSSNNYNYFTGLSNRKTGVNMKYQQDSDQVIDCFSTVVKSKPSNNGNATTTATAATTFTQDSSLVSKPLTLFQRDQSKQLFCIDEFVPAKAIDNTNNESITSDEYSETSSKLRSNQILNNPEEEKDNFDQVDMNLHFSTQLNTPQPQNDQVSPQNPLEIGLNPLESFDFLSKQEYKPIFAVSNTSDDLQDLIRNRSKSVQGIRSHLKTQYKSYFLKMHTAMYECVSVSVFYKQLKKAYKLMVAVQQQFVNNSADMMASSNYVQEKDNLYPLLRLILLTYLSANGQHRYSLFKLALMIEIIPNEIRTQTYIEELRKFILSLLELGDDQSELFSSQVYSDTLEDPNHQQENFEKDPMFGDDDGNDLTEVFEVVEYDGNNQNTSDWCSPQKNHKHIDS